MRPVATLIAAALIAAAVPAVAEPPAAAKTAPARQVVVSYFHGDVRCATCKKIEAYTRETVEKAFAAELADGRLVLRSVNTDRPENEHFVKDYSLVTRSVVVTDEAGGKVTRWVNLDKIWQLVRDQEAFSEYIANGVRAYLGESS